MLQLSLKVALTLCPLFAGRQMSISDSICILDFRRPCLCGWFMGVKKVTSAVHRFFSRVEGVVRCWWQLYNSNVSDNNKCQINSSYIRLKDSQTFRLMLFSLTMECLTGIICFTTICLWVFVLQLVLSRVIMNVVLIRYQLLTSMPEDPSQFASATFELWSAYRSCHLCYHQYEWQEFSSLYNSFLDTKLQSQEAQIGSQQRDQHLDGRSQFVPRLKLQCTIRCSTFNCFKPRPFKIEYALKFCLFLLYARSDFLLMVEYIRTGCELPMSIVSMDCNNCRWHETKQSETKACKSRVRRVNMIKLRQRKVRRTDMTLKGAFS